ncbi:MAG: hypothetical protein B7Y36_19000 [Novosphingobium sp. 28-62-57]|uniref:putative metallopeptidase n=1 Tax=Novosphingobium sp. 28-62-57 TaxID=1970409 RepID=UPI000BD85329|nr:putative metallopeptidase [Novosphingobium sp. 28-62-57]OYZ07701.1 MAG: hypothetical protein B7Y36_19000 [Novosphingobium sp. 28-62-57]OZA30507.1 MAG: hypothetical protein B7X92_15925 [Novosphingobium sp. 17-62-9]HQS96701.1 putative metallopeptidase [Novosphingobium sp.]
MSRPYPPQALLDTLEEVFAPADDLREWISATFIDAEGELSNPDHAHLAEASIGVLWTNCDNSRNMRSVIGQAELMPPMAMGKWQRARAIQQIEEWFDGLPDFLLTFSAPSAATMDDASFCALVEHELYHCAQKLDRYGMLAFNKEGKPVFAIRGHDVEEFVGVVSRYGAGASGVSEMVEAANRRPSIGIATIAGACGTCNLKVA